MIRGAQVYRFGPYELNAQTGELRKSGVRVRLGGQPIEVLTLLVQRAGEMVTREELKEALWKEDTFTDFDHGVNTAVQRIRRALDDSATEPKFIETLPRRGYRFVAEVQTDGAGTPEPSPPAPDRSLPRWAIAAAAISVLLVVAGFSYWRSSEPRPLTFTERAVTFDPGWERHPSLSPDGTRVAYYLRSDDRSPHDIYVQQLSPYSGPPTQVTSGPAWDVDPAWSPDGTKLVFGRFQDNVPPPSANRYQLLLASPTAGSPVQVLGEFETRSQYVRPSWSEDGRFIAFSCRLNVPEGRTQACIISPSSGEVWPVSEDVGGFAKFRRDGRAITYRTGDRLLVQSLNPDGRPVERPREVAPGYWYPHPAGWSQDDREIYFMGRSPELDYGLWAVEDRMGAEPRLLARLETPVSNGGPFPALRFGPQGEIQIIYEHRERSSSLVAVDLESGKTRHLTEASRMDFNPSFSPDGSRIAFMSNRTGVDTLWVSNRDGSNQEPIVEFPIFGGFSAPKWSPDDQRIAIDGMRETTNRALYIVDVAAKRASPNLTETGCRLPSWSRDSRWIYCGRSGEPAIWRFDVESGAREILLEGYGEGPFAESLDRKKLYFRNGKELMQADLDEQGRIHGQPESIAPDTVSFAIAQSGLYWMDPAGALWHLPNGAAEPRKIAEVPFRLMALQSGMSISPDEKTMVYTDWIRDESDLKLLESVPRVPQPRATLTRGVRAYAAQAFEPRP